MADENTPVLGRRVFFLYPPSVVQDEIVYDLIKHGYETYLIRDHVRVRTLLREFDDAVLFINIDKALSPLQWEEFIVQLMNDPELVNVKVGVLTYNIDLELTRVYRESIRPPYGYIRLKMSRQESLEIILRDLELHGARGRRQYVRARCDTDLPVTFYVKTHEETFTGQILDISAVGMASVFDKEINLAVNSHLPEIHINLHQVILRIAGSVHLVRGENPRVHVIMFDSDTGDLIRDKISIYVFANLQHFIERKLKELK